MSDPNGAFIGPLQNGQTRPSAAEMRLAELRQAIMEASKPHTVMAKDEAGNTVPTQVPPDPQEVNALVAAYKALSGEAPDAPVVLNVGNGKVAFVDPRTQQVTVQDTNTLSPEDKARADAIAQADLEYKQALTAQAVGNTRTPEEIASGVRRDDAAATASLASAEASRASAFANSPEGIRARAEAEADAATKLMYSRLEAGVELPAREAEELKQQHRLIAERAAAELKAFYDREAFEREKPYKDLAAEQVQQGLDQSRAFQEGQLANQRAAEQRARVVEEAKPLLDQSQSMDSLLRESAKAGVAPVAGATALVFDPLQAANQKLAALAQSGAVPAQFMPTPAAPRPTTASTSGAPAPARTTTTAPAPGSVRNLTGGMA